MPTGLDLTTSPLEVLVSDPPFTFSPYGEGIFWI